MHIKNVIVRNPKVVQVLIPGFISSEKWGLKPDDVLEVFISDDGEEITIKKRPENVSLGSIANKEGKRIFGTTT